MKVSSASITITLFLILFLNGLISGGRISDAIKKKLSSRKKKTEIPIVEELPIVEGLPIVEELPTYIDGSELDDSNEYEDLSGRKYDHSISPLFPDIKSKVI